MNPNANGLESTQYVDETTETDPNANASGVSADPSLSDVMASQKAAQGTEYNIF